MHAIRTVSVVITGRVQGVSYRAWTRERANALGLGGTVRNREDGSVEAVFSGPAEAVAQMVELCRSGPAGSRVAGLSVSELGRTAAAEGFEIVR